MSSRLLSFVTIAVLLVRAPLLHAQAAPGAQKAIVELHKSGKLYEKDEYGSVRKAFARLFEERNAIAIRQAYGEDHGALSKWLNEHSVVKESFYTAIDEKNDKIVPALTLFRQIWKAHPDQLEQYAHLAIAIAVTWDNPRGVYEYGHHQRRTKSKMPEGLVDALGNFRYLVDNDKAVDGRSRLLPWEFLLFAADHRTPLDERKWAQTYFKGWKVRLSQGKAKSVHGDVQYDNDMLKGERDKSSGLQPRLSGQEYTLQNLKQYGGVCAQQADFAARVGKSLCIPGTYCSGQSAYRGRHAWWMFVQINKITPNRIHFVLVSDGRYRGFEKDKFYVGQVTDPQTGQRILDRDLERRLWTIGTDSIGTRQTRLLMSAYPWLATELKLDAGQRIDYLQKCLQISAYCEPAWLELARMARAGELTGDHAKAARAGLSVIGKKFADYPDFIFKLCGDLLSAELTDNERLQVWQQAEKLFVRAERGDLACKAQLQIAELFGKHVKWRLASRGLVATINKFPTEGRYVPDLAKKLEDVCAKYPKGTETAAKTYVALVPAMIKHYRGDNNDYCKKIYRQALTYVQTNKLTKFEQALKTQAEVVKFLQSQ